MTGVAGLVVTAAMSSMEKQRSSDSSGLKTVPPPGVPRCLRCTATNFGVKKLNLGEKIYALKQCQKAGSTIRNS